MRYIASLFIQFIVCLWQMPGRKIEWQRGRTHHIYIYSLCVHLWMYGMCIMIAKCHSCTQHRSKMEVPSSFISNIVCSVCILFPITLTTAAVVWLPNKLTNYVCWFVSVSVIAFVIWCSCLLYVIIVFPFVFSLENSLLIKK